VEDGDAELITRSSIEPGAFAGVYDRHAEPLFRFLVRRVGRDTADELLGDVFRVAFERRETFDPSVSTNARPWLYGIATNLLARHRRAEARRLRATARFRVTTTADVSFTEGIDASVDAANLWPQVVDAIANLPDGERDALLLYAWEELSYDEIASALEVPVGTVRSRLNRARGRLRDISRELDPARGETQNDPWRLADERKRLMTLIDGKDNTPLERSVPAMYPRIAYRDEVAALEWLTRVFGFVERREARREPTEEWGMLAWLEFGDGVVMIGRVEHEIHQIYSPSELGHTTAMINVRVDGIDEHYERAQREGATIAREIEDAFFGIRRYEALDLEGHRWHFDEPLTAVEARQARRM
jgi:RNA polymerase sigma factor (sigma-70 family)